MAGVSPQAFNVVKRFAPCLILLPLLAACFSLATVLQERASSWSKRGESNNILNVLLGDGRRMFANHFFVQADVAFHSGYYPSIFDQARMPKDTSHLTAKEGDPAMEEHEKQMNFLGPPRDWIERFGRHFTITEHTHLEGQKESEILPWLKLASELDPQKIETYTVAAYWLRDLGKVKEAERFLRQGLLNNPNSCEILFDLGRLYYENNHDAARARKIWELALRRWGEQEAANKKPDILVLGQIGVNLAHLEETEGNLARAIQLLELSQKASPHPEALQKQIDDLKQKLAARPSAAAAAPQAR
jgi:tetratricopeptide (TPR) repeat protein